MRKEIPFLQIDIVTRGSCAFWHVCPRLFCFKLENNRFFHRKEEHILKKDFCKVVEVFMMDKKGNVDPNTMYVLLFITTIPSILFYLLAQKNIVRGVSADGIKG